MVPAFYVLALGVVDSFTQANRGIKFMNFYGFHARKINRIIYSGKTASVMILFSF